MLLWAYFSTSQPILNHCYTDIIHVYNIYGYTQSDGFCLHVHISLVFCIGLMKIVKGRLFTLSCEKGHQVPIIMTPNWTQFLIFYIHNTQSKQGHLWPSRHKNHRVTTQKTLKQMIHKFTVSDVQFGIIWYWDMTSMYKWSRRWDKCISGSLVWWTCLCCISACGTPGLGIFSFLPHIHNQMPLVVVPHTTGWRQRE